MATIQYARLYPDALQLQAKNGTNLTAGWVMVFLAGTDDPATTYADFNGTVNPQKIVIDDNGRFCAIVDKAKAYRVEVYDSEGMLQWTTEPVWCTGNAGSGMSVTEVVSTDGSITVDKSTAGSVTTYDIGLAPSDSDEFLEWIKCSEEDCGATWKPVYQAGTMETEAGQGIKVHGGHLYHFTNTFTVDPDGTGINYETFRVNMHCGGQIVDSRDFDIDTSLNDAVMCEFSYDLIPEEDGYVYFTLTIPSGCEAAAEVQCHRIYSGINAVPDTCATKQWVNDTFDYNMSEKISYSALGYNGNGEISGISGSAIYGGLDSATVSSIASSYAESAISSISGWSGGFSSISSKIDWSSSGVFQPSGNYQTAGDYAYNSSLSSKVDQSAFDDCYSAVHSALDDKLDKSASGQFATSGDYAYNSSLSSYIPASASGMFQPSGNYQSAGDYAFNSSVSSKLDASASSDFVLNSVFSSYSSEVESGISSLSSTVSDLTGQYIEQSASGMFQPSGNYVSSSDMSSYVPFSGLESDGVHITGISGSALGGGGSGHEYSGIAPVLVDNTAETIGVDSVALTVDSTMTSYMSGSSAVLGVNVDGLGLSGKMDATASSLFYSTSNPSGFIGSSYVDSAVSGKMDASASSQFLTSLPADMATTGDVASAVSGKLDASASSDFYTTANESGFITGVDLSPYAYQSAVESKADSSALSGYQLTADMSAYQLSGDYAYNSSLSSKLDASASSDFYSTSNPSGFISGVDLTPYQTTAGMSAYQLTADMSGYQVSGDYAYNSSLSSKLDASASSNFQTTADMSGYYTTANESGFITGVDLTPYQTTAGMTAYQEASGMTAYQPAGDYQPSGDYIQESALGWVEV